MCGAGAGGGTPTARARFGARQNSIPPFMNGSLFERFTERRAGCLGNGEDNLRGTKRPNNIIE